MHLDADQFKILFEAFDKPYFQFLSEFRLTDFIFEPFAFIGFIARLENHPMLQLIDFSRDELNEDMISAVLHRIYNNPPVQKIVFTGNPISVGIYMEQVVVHLFNHREDHVKLYLQ